MTRPNCDDFTYADRTQPVHHWAKSREDTTMFCVNETEAASIRAAFDEGGEFSAAVEFRRLFPGVADTAKARHWARVIAGWKSPTPPPSSVVSFAKPKRR